MTSAQETPQYTRLRATGAGPCRTLTLHYPERRNAIGPQMIDELLHALDAAQSDPLVRVIVLTGEGKSFCVGGDFGQMADIAGEAGNPSSRAATTPISSLALWHAKKPVVAKVNGHAMGGGLGLVAASTFAVASDDGAARHARDPRRPLPDDDHGGPRAARAAATSRRDDAPRREAPGAPRRRARRARERRWSPAAELDARGRRRSSRRSRARARARCGSGCGAFADARRTWRSSGAADAARAARRVPRDRRRARGADGVPREARAEVDRTAEEPIAMNDARAGGRPRSTPRGGARDGGPGQVAEAARARQDDGARAPGGVLRRRRLLRGRHARHPDGARGRARRHATSRRPTASSRAFGKVDGRMVCAAAYDFTVKGGIHRLHGRGEGHAPPLDGAQGPLADGVVHRLGRARASTRGRATRT